MDTRPRERDNVALPVLRARRRARKTSSEQRTPALSDEDRAFLQDRFALFTRTMGLLFVGIVATSAALYYMYPELRSSSTRSFYAFTGAMIIVTLALWIYCRRTVLPARTLRRLDAAIMVVAGMVIGAVTFLMSDLPHNFWLGYIFNMLIVFGRALVVPSTGERTLWISTLAVAPTMVSAVAITIVFPERLRIPTMAMIGAGVVLPLVQVWLATLGSSVIYGLRAEVRQIAQLGQYTLNEKIGEGGMGSVYKATHAMLRRPTAIKILRPDLTSPETLRRFEREVQATSELTHPNTIAIYDYGRSPDGVFYYAMEYLDGLNLEELVRRDGPIAHNRVIHILRQVCAALAEAHDRGLIHRDIKPANIILCERGGVVDVAKVLDFGLVKDIDESPSLLSNEIVAGTPLYMSPESITSPASVAEASDIYAIGATIYFLVTGCPVFTGKTVAEICNHHMHTQPLPPRVRNPDAHIDDETEDLILRCLAKSPKDRPLSVRELGTELAALPASNSWTQDAARKWWTEFRLEKPAETSGRESNIATAPTINVDFEDRLS